MTPGERMEATAQALEDVRVELEHALVVFPTFNSPHEGYAVIAEELDELWDDVKANAGRLSSARSEAIQIAAMAVRYVVDLSPETAP